MSIHEKEVVTKDETSLIKDNNETTVHTIVAKEEDEGIKQSLDNPIQAMVNLFKDISKVSIKTDQEYLAYSTANPDTTYEEMEKNKHDYLFQLRAIPGKEPEDLFEYTALNETSFMSKHFFIGPAKGLKFSIFQKVDVNQAFNTGLVFEKKIENPFSFKNTQSIVASVDGEKFGEVSVDNGWVYDTYYIHTGAGIDKARFAVRINKYTWEYNFRNTILCNFKGLEFPILNEDGIVVGKIRKDNPSNPSKICQGWSNIDYFVVEYPGDATAEEKIMMMGLAVALDDLHISDNKKFYI